MGVCPGQVRARARRRPGFSGLEPLLGLGSPSVRGEGDGVTGPQAGQSLGPHSLGRSCTLALGPHPSVWWVHSVLPCAPPEQGLKGGQGRGSSGLSPLVRSRGAETSVICAWQVGDGSLGQRGGLNRAPAWAPVSAHACPAGLPLPGEGLCAAGTPGGWGRPRGGRFWGCPLVGTRKGAVLASLPAPTPLRDSRPLCPRGPHPGLGTKIHWTFLPAPPDWLAAAALQRKDVGSERLGVWRRAPAAHGGRGLAPPRALPATSSPILPPQAQTP